MAEKSKTKFSQYLAANDLKDVYFQEVFDFLYLLKKYLSRLEDTWDKEKLIRRQHVEIEEINS